MGENIDFLNSVGTNAKHVTTYLAGSPYTVDVVICDLSFHS